MNHKNLFLINGIICLLFGIPLLFFPQPILQMYATEAMEINGILSIVSKGYGTILMGFGVALLSATKAPISYGRRALLLTIVISHFLLIIVHGQATLQGIENRLGWTLVIQSVLLFLWGGNLLLKEKMTDR